MTLAHQTPPTASVPLAGGGSGAREAPQRTAAPVLFGFSAGMIGDRIFRDAPALLLLIYMTNVLAIPPALAGLAVFLPKTLIIFVDPLVGSWSDQLRSPWGRRRPFLAAGALLSTLSFILFFHVPRLPSPTLQAAYMGLIILLGFSGYSLFSVPYLTMGAEIAADDQDRRRVMSWRVGFMAIGLSASAFAGGLVQALGGGVAGYRTMSLAYAGICFAAMGSTVVAAGRFAQSPGQAEPLSLAQQMKVVAANRPYCRLLLVCLTQKVGEGVGYGSFAYFCIYVVGQPLSSIGIVVLASTIGQILTQPLWLRASRRWSPFTLYAVGVLGWCVNLMLWLAMKGQSTLWLIPLGLQAGAAAGGFLMVTLGMLSNVLAADVRRTGLNREGAYSGVWSATEKLGFAGGALLVGLALGLFGFTSGEGGAAGVQSSGAVLGIALTYCGLNAAIYLLSIVAMRRVEPTNAAPPAAAS